GPPWRSGCGPGGGWNVSRTLVTGATGFIGCRLCELWHGEGRAVQATGLVRNDVERARAAALAAAGVPFTGGDLAGPPADDSLWRGVETVVHLAAAQHEANVDAGYFIRTNVDATRALLEASERHGVRRFFYASSIGVYGANNAPGLDEDTPLAPDNDYGRSKAAAERE